MTCNHFLVQYSAYRDAIDPGLVAEVDDHLVACADCREHEAAIRRGISALHGEVIVPSPDFERTLNARLARLERFPAPTMAPTAVGALVVLLLSLLVLKIGEPAGIPAAAAQSDPPSVARPAARPGLPFVAFVPPPAPARPVPRLAL